ncbi:hypothetical protein ACLB2K_005522 [Fragaria x ananassa]
MCKTLRSLKQYWYENDLSVEPPELGCFPNLKVFHAIVGASEVPSIVKLLSRCPVLEFLTIEGITPYGDDQVNDIEVTGPELKTLKISAPKLEDIVLVSSTKFEVEDSVFQWNPPEEVPICLSSHLKTIYITGFKGRQAEIEMAKYLLKNSPFLKK